MDPAGAAHRAVKRELLVRFLDSAVPALLHGPGFTYAEGYAGAAATRGEPSAIAALRVFGEFADRLPGHRLTVVLVGADAARLESLSHRAAGVCGELGLPAEVSVQMATGGCDESLVPALRQAGSFGAPIIAYLDAVGADPPGYDTVAALAARRHADVLIGLDPAALTTTPDAGGDRLFGAPDWRAAADQPPAQRYPYLVTCYREALRRTGLGQVAHVELVDDSGYPQLLFFATAAGRSFDHFKGALWAVDEFAGVRYRDPRDPEHALLDISLDPHLGPLRRALVERVRGNGECPAAQLRDYTRAETIYRAEDAFPALSGLIAAGRLGREPQRGRLTPATIISTR